MAHLVGFLSLFKICKKIGAYPYLVFDGKAGEQKDAELAMR